MRSHIAAASNNGDPVMFPMANGLRGQAQKGGAMPTKTVRVTALLGALVLVGIAASALTMSFDRSVRWPSFAAAVECSAVTEKTERLGCYDRFAPPPAPQPFRGANAPALGGSL
jgi:hypothetical protein